LSYGPISLDQRTRRVTVEDAAVVLSQTEFRLLEYLLLHAEQPVSREDLARHVWDVGDRPGSNVIDVYVSYLRKRLGSARPLVRTVRRVGYMIARGRRIR
jgi:DNA-binding response OmpR family regulator